MNPHNKQVHCIASRSLPTRSSPRSLAMWFAFIALFLISGASAFAQLDTGAIAGTILDPLGKVVLGAKVTVHSLVTGTDYSTVSSATGYYVFPSVRPGVYNVTATAAGFKTAVHSGVVVSVGRHTSQDITLAIGEATETISVTAGGQALEADTSEIDASIQPDQVENLPLSVGGGFRSLETLVYLVPGVVGTGTASAADAIKINGGQENGTDFLIDGITTNRQQNGSGSFGILSPSVDAVSEFHVSISALPAELGRTTGGLSNFNTKGGTNNYHGSVFDFYKNAVLDGNTWFNNGHIAEQGYTAAAKETYKRGTDTKNDYGLNLGGPVRIPHIFNGKDKTFFFFNWEQWRQNYGGAVTSKLPTPAELGSDGQYFDFSSLLGAQISGVTAKQNACTQTLYYGEILDPDIETTGSGDGLPCRSVAFANNKIPISRANSISKNIVDTYLMPLAKQEITGSSNYNYVQRSPGTINNTAYSFRIDQNLGAKNKIWVFWSSRENTDSGGNSDLPVPIQTCCSTVDQLGKIFRAGWDWTVTPTMVNSLTVGGNRSNNINKSKASQMGTDWDSKLGIANGSSNDFPVFEFYNNDSLTSLGQQKDSTDIDNVIALNEILHWQHGAHSLKLGGEAQYHQYSWISSIGGTCSGEAGCIEFWDNQNASDETWWGSTGNSFAAFLTGNTGNMSNLHDLHAPRWITHYGAVFAQDDWKVKPNLTVNIGFRWSYDTPRREAAGDTSIWDPNLTDAATTAGLYGQAKGALVFAGKGTGRNGSKNETWGSVYKKNFEPRVGFAWEPDFLSHKDVIRGSAGIYYGPLVYADWGQGTVQGFTVTGSQYTADPLSGVNLSVGLAALPTTPNLDPNQLDGTSTNADYVSKGNGRPGMVETWALELQHQITPNLIASVGYLGQHATHLHAMLTYMNDLPDKYMSLGNYLEWWAIAPGPDGWNGNSMEPYGNFSCASGCTWPESEEEYQALRPFPQIEYINMDSYLQNMGQSTYNALEAKLEQRFHNGLSVMASYTFSKTLTDADVIQPYQSTNQNGGAVQDPENLKGEKAVSSEDIPQNFVISYTYELPIGKNKHFLGNTPKPVNAIISGWSVSGIQRYQSGQPMSIYNATGIPGKNSSVRFDRVAGQKVKNSAYKNPLDFKTGNDPATGKTYQCETGYFNCDAFYDPNLGTNRATQTNGAYRFGTMPRNSADIRWVPYKTEDFGISKSIPIHGNIKADFRGELFDAFNRHIFTRPVSDLNSATTTTGQIGGLQNGPRNVQFRLRISF